MTNQTECEIKARKDWMGLLARGPDATLMTLWVGIQDRPSFEWLRRPEVGVSWCVAASQEPALCSTWVK